MVRGDAQPHSEAKVRGTSRQVRATACSPEPSRSWRGAAESARSWRGMSSQPQMNTARPIGRLTKKIQRQPRWSTICPPSTGPTLNPT